MADEERASLAVDGTEITFTFGSKSSPVLNGLNISVQRGIIYGLLGPSGCGKTTLLHCIVGRHKPSSGSIRIYGKEPGQKGSLVPGPGVGFMPQELALYPEITTSETLTYFGQLYQMDSKQIKERICFLTKLLDIPDKNKQIVHLSGGQQRRVSFAAALIHKPPLIILDEPTVGVDPLLRRSIWDHLQTLADTEFISIIVTTHYVEEARQAHVVGLMRDGQLLAEMNPEMLMQRYNAQTLEDVFLKLCIKEREGSEALPSDEIDESQKLVWIPLSAQRLNCMNSISTNQNHCDHNEMSKGKDYEVDVRNKCSSAFKQTVNRMNALITKNVVRLKRNIPFVFFQIFVPVSQAIVFCLCVGGEPFDLPLAIVNLETDPSGKSNEFIQHLSNRTIFQNNFDNLSLALNSVERGENWGVLYIGPKFTDAMIDRFLMGMEAENETIEDSTIKLYLDTTNQQIAITIFTKIMSSFKDFSEDALKRYNYNPLIASPPVVLQTPIYGDLEPNFTEFTAPGMIVGITYMMAMALSAISIIIERKEGLLDRSWVAGVQSWEVVFSILFVLFVINLFQVALVLVFTFKAFSIPCRGPLIWVIFAVLLVGFEGMAYGLLISSMVKNENVAMMIAMASFYPSLLFSGIIWPVEAMPYVLRYFSYCLPLTLITDSIRSNLSRGWGILEHGTWVGYLVALAWTVPVLLLSIIFSKYRR